MKYFTIGLVILGICVSIFGFVNAYIGFTHPIKYNEEIIEISNRNNISPSLIASVINVESRYRKDAKSSRGAIGLMQVKYSTALYMKDYYKLTDDLKECDLYDPEINIKYGCMYLKYLILKFEIVETALASYNAGETLVRSWLNDGIHSIDKKTLEYIPYEETRNYVQKINNNMKFYNKIFKEQII